MKNPLSRRQAQVLQGIGEGHDLKQIAAHLHLSVETVANYQRNARIKLSARTVVAAVGIAVREGFIPGSNREEVDFSCLESHEEKACRALAQGLTRSQMAKQFFVSERTVDRWLDSASVKLGVDNRAVLAAVTSKHLRTG